jgi:Tfp pilus assembly protein PilF
MSRPRLIALLLALGTLVVFLPVGGFNFIAYDDPAYVSENPFVKNGLNWTDIQWAFTTFHASNWHPLTWLSHMADCSLFGSNPGAQHFVNVLFHSANTALLFLLLWRLTQKIRPAALVAALFAWHPLHIQSVAWISERKDVLSTFFALLALLSYAKFALENRRRSYWFALGFFALGLMSKPMLVTLPFVLLLLDFWPLRRMPVDSWQPEKIRRLAVEKIPFFLLIVPACIVTCLAQRGAMVPLERLAFSLRLENSMVAYACYLLKLFWPENLAFFYPMPVSSFWMPAAAAAVLVAISVFSWRVRRSFPYVPAGWFWFLGTLVPVIGLVQVGEQAMADRYAYFPAIGIFIIVAFGGMDLAGRFRFAKIISMPAAVLILASCVLATENQLRYWRTDEVLFAHALAVTRDNIAAHINLGYVYEKQDRIAEAMNEYRLALKIDPRRADVHNNIAGLLADAGRLDEALPEYQTALQLNPDAMEAHLNLGIAMVKLKRFDEAARQFNLAAKLKPDDARPDYETGKSLLKQGRDAAAIDEFRKALKLDPYNCQILAFTARVLAADENAAVRDGRSALDFATRANNLSGGSLPMALDALGMACAETGDFANAIICAQRVLDIAGAVQMKNTGAMQTRLELYKKQQPWRESFQATNAPAEN